MLRFYGVTESVAASIAASTSKERLIDCVEYMLSKGRIVKDSASYLMAALKKNWNVPALDAFSREDRWQILLVECAKGGLLT